MKSKVVFNYLFAVLFAGILFAQANVVKTATASQPISSVISAPTPWTGNISVATWVKLNSYSNAYPRLISKLGSFELIMYTNSRGSAGRLEWDVRTPSEKDTVTNNLHKIPLNTWTHVAATYNGSVSKIYINGVKVAERTISGTITNSSWPIGLGMQSNGGRTTDAIFSQATATNSAFTDQQVQTLFQSKP